MPAKQHGTAYLYGIPETPIAQSTIIDIRYGKQKENVDVIPDQKGRRASLRADDQTDTVEIDLRITGAFVEPELYTKATITGSEKESDNGDYFVKTTSRAKHAKGHTEFTLSLERWEYLTLSANPTVPEPDPEA